MDYVELKKMLQDYLQCDEPTFQQNVNQFIRAAERRIYMYARTPESRASFLGTLSTTSATIETPNDFQEPLQMIVTIAGVPVNLLLKEPSFISEAYAGAATGPPRYYGILTTGSDTNVVLVFGPAPNLAYSYELRYVRTPPSIVDVNLTWLSDQAHHALLYESLVEGYTFLKGDPNLLKVYQDRAAEAKDDVKRLTDGILHMDVYRNPELRTQV